LGPAKDHKGDKCTFWNPITKHVFESRLAILLDPSYADFHELDQSQIANQVATITDEVIAIFDESIG
jgi:hypothetical protein